MTVLAIAHRAGNSLAGLREANALGVDVVECDVHEFRGRLEVRHDKTAGPLPFLWDRWELTSASAPRLGLRELLEAAGRDTTFMLDLKGRRTRAGRSVARLLHELGHDHPVLVCGRYWPAVDMLAGLSYVQPVLSARTAAELTRLQVRLTRPDRVHGVSLHHTLLDAALVERLRRRVEVVMTWPVNDGARLADVLSLGVNGVISDEPDVLGDLIAHRG